MYLGIKTKKYQLGSLKNITQSNLIDVYMCIITSKCIGILNISMA